MPSQFSSRRNGAACLRLWTFCSTARGSGRGTPPKALSLKRFGATWKQFQVKPCGLVCVYGEAFCSAAGLQRDVPEVRQLKESSGRQLLRPQSHAVPGVVPKHAPARVAARGRRHHGKCSRKSALSGVTEEQQVCCKTDKVEKHLKSLAGFLKTFITATIYRLTPKKNLFF